MQLLSIPFSLFYSSFLLFATTAVPVSSTELTPDTFDSTVAKGLWFIEHFSPYCGHCNHFKPTWEQLVAEAKTEIPSVNTATINCVTYGDLCSKNNIEGYPTMLMFEDGKIVDKFKGARELDLLKAFMKKYVKDEPLPEPEPSAEITPEKPAPPVQPPKPLLNSAGEVLPLTSDTFDDALAKGPAFVKFFAPWCGHCKKLAPTWKQLARHMQGKVTVAEVNCDDNSSLCKAQGIQGYPTLVWFGQGNNENGRSEYNSGRKFDQLAAFAEKASAAGVDILEKTEELKAHVARDDVVYLLLHAQSDTEVISMMREASAALLGQPRILASSNAALRTQFGIPAASEWVLLVIKDHDIRHPASTFYGTSSTSATDPKLRKWLMGHRLPTTLELSRDNFQSVMNAPQKPFVVLSAGPLALKDKIMERLRDVGEQWRIRTDGSGVMHGREVVFAWMDGGEWADWLKSMYGITDADVVPSGGDELAGVKVVIADHNKLIYYDSDRDSRPIEFTSTASLFGGINDALSRNSSYKHSESFIERIARSLNNKMIAVENFVFEKPAQAIVLFIILSVFIIYVISRLVSGDVTTAQQGQAEWIQNKGKNGRLD